MGYTKCLEEMLPLPLQEQRLLSMNFHQLKHEKDYQLRYHHPYHHRNHLRGDFVHRQLKGMKKGYVTTTYPLSFGGLNNMEYIPHSLPMFQENPLYLQGTIISSAYDNNRTERDALRTGP